MTRFFSARWACVFSLLTATAAAQTSDASHPPQFTTVDAYHYSHNSWYKFWKFPWQPQDWTSPVDYSRGETYLRYEVRNLRQPVMLQLCYFQDRHVSEKHACGPQWTFDAPGVYYRRIGHRSLWQRNVIDWTRELLDFMLIDNASQGQARASVEVTAIIVAQGQRLTPPEHWQCPTDWNCVGAEPPTPVDPDPEDPDPEDPTPVDPDPEEPTPVDPAPQDPAPEDPAPEDPAPEDPAPEDPAPEDPAPEVPAPRPGDGTPGTPSEDERGAGGLPSSPSDAPPGSTPDSQERPDELGDEPALDDERGTTRAAGCSLTPTPLERSGATVAIALLTLVGWLRRPRKIAQDART